MSKANDLWEDLGELSDEDAGHVLMRLFTAYEQEHEAGQNSTGCADFFKKLGSAINQTTECNLNRR